MRTKGSHGRLSFYKIISYNSGLRQHNIYCFAGTYVWDESHEVAQYINWAPGQPDSNGGDHDCIFKTYDDPGWPAQGWYDGHCSWDHENYHGISKQIHALCEIDL